MSKFYKNQKIILLIMGLCILLIIIILLALITQPKKSNNTNNTTSNTANNNISNNNISNTNQENAINNENETDEYNNFTNADNTEQSATDEATGNDLIKQALLDSTWLSNNLYLKKDCFGNDISSKYEQKLSFIKIGNEDTENPIVIVKAECNDVNANQCYFITNESGEVKVNQVSESTTHSAHTEYVVDSKNSIFYVHTTYSDIEQYDIYKIESSGISKVGTIIKQNYYNGSQSDITYYYNENVITENEYNKIKSNYIYDMQVKAEYQVVNTVNINKYF